MAVSRGKTLRLEYFFRCGMGCVLALASVVGLEKFGHGLGIIDTSSLWTAELGVLALLFALMMLIRRDFIDKYTNAVRLIRENADRADRDDLTGALSRHAFLLSLNRRLDAIRYAQIHGGVANGFALALIDVDNFKAINDTHGHAAGDKVLRLIAEVAAAEPDWQIGRLGGDEFGIILPFEDEAIIKTVLDHFSRTLLARRDVRVGQVGFSGVSIGFALAPEHGSTETGLVQAADMALYAVKSAGKGAVLAFETALRREFNSERNLMRELRAAILLDHLEVHYQPLTDGAGGIKGAEALVRWRHPVIGPISPAAFVPVAERHGMIAQLTDWVFRRVCRDIGLSAFPYISVNLSAVLLDKPSVIDGLYKAMADAGCSAGQFALEITETAVVNASDTVIRTLQRLRKDGFRIALDDFGTGHCHFTALRSLPVDIVKIDRSYVQKLDTDRVAQIFMAATNQVAEALGLTIIAEGVETIEQRELARLCGATCFQGYLEGRPAPLAVPPALGQTRLAG